MQTTKHVDLDNARKEDQRAVMEQIIQDDACPFCLENLRRYHTQPILKEGAYWLLTPNQWPYAHTKVHLLAIYKTHAEKLSDLDPAAGAELLELLQWAERELKVPGGGFVIRFGDTNHSAGSVVHLHAQFIQPDLNDPEYEPVRVKLGKRKEQLQTAA